MAESKDSPLVRQNHSSFKGPNTVTDNIVITSATSQEACEATLLTTSAVAYSYNILTQSCELFTKITESISAPNVHSGATMQEFPMQCYLACIAYEDPRWTGVVRLRNLWRDRRWDLVKFRFRVKDDWLPANVRRRYSLPFHIFGPLGMDSSPSVSSAVSGPLDPWVLGFIITIEESAMPGFFLFILRRSRGAQEANLDFSTAALDFTSLGGAPGKKRWSASDCAALFSNAISQRPGEKSPHVDGVQAYTAQLYRHGPLNLVTSEPKLPMRNLLVLQISNSPVIQAWNFMNPYQRIEVGHAIMAVNGKTDPYEMLQELATAQTLNLFIKDKMTRVQQRHFEESSIGSD
ncbi:unnamed protein product [Cladocopium goreaui]|uniref:Uncharacterized protein n=1 Tax=Cladocopium goreaui TaxID=2562237 RepID=A0A9P1CZH7_9DINO|nr:unnamed protein product [Cladocopium goreaui]